MAVREEVTPGATEPMTPVPMQVLRNRRETHDTFTLDIAPPGDGFSYQPGQFNMLYVFGVGEAPISISGDPARPDRLIHTIRSVGAVTAAMRRLNKGDWVGVRGPYGRGWPVDEAKGSDIVIVAGGVGLAPVRSVVYTVLADRSRFGRVALLYGARTPEDILFRAELERWRARFDMEVDVTVDRAFPDWRGHVGVVTGLIPHAQFDPMCTVAMVCGPEVMMRFTAHELMVAGVEPDRIYLSMERNMKCAVGQCGRCVYGPTYVCKDGPVFRYDEIGRLLRLREV